MNELLLVMELLKDKLGTGNVYTGEIPEQQTEPSILLTHIASPFSRTVDGRKTNKYTSWRLTVVAKAQSDVESLLEQLEDMDCMRTTEFQKVFTNLVMREFGQNEQPFRRAFYDLITYK